jgi:hypothetical protein
MKLVLPLLAVLAAARGAAADDFAVEALKDPPPGELAEPVRKELASGGVRVLRGGKPFMDVWLRGAAPASQAKAPLGVRFPELRPGGLLGAVRIHGGGSDFKNQKYPAGLFTLRYQIQPEDGDHQGTSDSRDFLLLGPAAADASSGDLSYPESVKLSAKVNGKKHPIVLWLVPPAEEGKGPRVVKDDQRELVLLELSMPLGQAGGKPISLALVIVGKAAEQ